MAHIQREKIKRAGGSEFKLGSIKSVEQTLHEVSLQTYLEEVNLYEQLLNPIAQIMEKNMGVNPMGLSALAQGGWGQEGDKMVPALRDIGVITSPDTNRKTLSGLNFNDKAQSAANSRRTSAKNSARGDSNKKSRNGTGDSNKSGTAPTTLSRQASWNSNGTPAGILSRQSSYNDANAPLGAMSKQNSWNERTPAPSMSRQVSWNESSFSARSFNSEASSEAPVPPAKMQPLTPLEVLHAAKLRKKRARKSYLPALDAHSVIYEHQRQQTEQQYIGDLKTLNRMFEKQSLEVANTRRDGDNKSVMRSGASVAPQQQRQSHQQQQLLSPIQSVHQKSVVSAGAESPLDAERTTQSLPSKLHTSQQQKQQMSEHQLSEQEVFWNDVNKAAREEAEAQRREVVEKRRARKRAMVRSSTIPWELLDQVDGAKVRFEHEKLYHDFNHKY